MAHLLLSVVHTVGEIYLSKCTAFYIPSFVATHW